MTFKSLLNIYETGVERIYTPQNDIQSQFPPTASVDLESFYDITAGSLYDPSRYNFDPNSVDYMWTELKEGKMGKDTKLMKFANTREIPLLSAIDDAQRIAKFQFSGKGLLFLAKQALLQTGNTFGITRLINPLFVIGNAIPFFHFRRQLLPLPIIQNPSSAQRLIGRLQVQTVNELGGYLTNDGVYGGFNKNLPNRMTKGFFSKDIFKKITSPISSVRDAVKLSRGTLKTDGLAALYIMNKFPLTHGMDKNGTLTNVYTLRLQAYEGMPEGNSLQEQYLNGPGVSAERSMFYGGGIRSFQKILLKNNMTVEEAYTDSYTHNLENIDTYAILDALNYDRNNPREQGQAPMPFLIKGDPSGRVSRAVGTTNKSAAYLPNEKLKDVYKALEDNSNKDDYVITKLKVGKYTVQFRSFIKDIKENITSDYTERNYVGRTERFMSYVSTKRELSFTLQLIAMSEAEMLATHSRLNFLIGAMFPADAIQGLMQPPISFLTIGDLFTNQPGVFKNLAIDFPYSWDVRGGGVANANGYQLPMGANITAAFSIIEKGTMFHQSPFHAIMEKF